MPIFGRIGMTRPEKFPKPFNIYSEGTETSTRGRLKLAALELKGHAMCTLSVAKPDEVEFCNQLGVHVTHTILQRGTPVAKENDVFKLVKNGKETRVFRVMTIRNSGEMDIDTTYMCEERGDVK